MKNAIIILLFFSTGLFQSCGLQNKQHDIILSSETLIDTASASCPFLTKDSNGNVVLTWIRKTNSSMAYCYAVSTDEGKTFNAPIEIPSSGNAYEHAENLPKIIFKPSGEIIAVWGAANPNPKNMYSGLIFYSQSFDNGKNWSNAKKLVNDTAGIDQRYFDVTLMPNGEAGIIWLDNRKRTNHEGSALYFATTKGKDGFKNEKLINESACECCRTDLFTDTKKNIHVLYRAIINDSIRDMVHCESVNEGNDFSPPVRISNDNWVINGCPHTGPAMAENSYGLQFTWFTGGTNAGIYYDHSNNNETGFSERNILSGPSGRHPQIATLANDNIAIVWDENFIKNKKAVSLIGLQERSGDGKNILKKYITADRSLSSYPVITALNNNAAIIAYTTSVNNKSYVVYRLASFE
jgi:hypothetical protein